MGVGEKIFRPLTAQERIQAFKQARPLAIKFKRPEIRDAYYNLLLDEVKVGMGFTGSRVTSISSDGWADRAGVELYDEIVELGGVDFFSLNDREKIEKLKQPRPLVLKFKRPGRIMRADYVNSGGNSKKKLPGFPDSEINTRLVQFNNVRSQQAPPPISPALGGVSDATPMGIGAGGGAPRESAPSGPLGWFSRCCAPRESTENEMTVSRYS